ncbi:MULTISPECIES: hypothetical protein [unclassified Streptomyces]|uniref:hypothetical protein n=1 Tax=Streptomyces TaxID=1883 RepID=UPI00190611CF|nr:MULTISPECIES: hypothetical protein [unclassified Streptomyces]MCU4746812.1 hypothetical protein [Streptomyces sp. G-5]QQN77518.1 hypothetical protein IPZ77_08695 [Streptomyces sp. XC 2026]
MNTNGTIGNPAAHGPRRISRIRPLNDNTADLAAVAPRQDQNRITELYLIPEALARSHMSERVREAESQRMSRQVAIAGRLHRKSRRLQARAERASNRARRALAQAVLHQR